MGVQVQELIDKIKQEGIQQAETRAREIESRAQAEAQKIIQSAKDQARAITEQAHKEAHAVQEATHKALEYAARDTLLQLRRTIQHVLGEIMKQEIKHSLTAEALAGILKDVILTSVRNDSAADVIVEVSPDDKKKLRDNAVKKLQERLKSPLIIRASEDMDAGFTISFDGGRSCFDFTDQSLVSFLSQFVNTDVTSLLKSSINSSS